jgi:hypothetical protein
VNIRSHTTLVGVFPMVPYMGKAVQGAFSLRQTRFTGRFTLPFEASWGGMVLAGGEYSLYYGTLQEGITYVEICGIGESSPKGIFLIWQQFPATVVQNSLVCVRKGNRHIIRALELPAVGTSITFAVPSSNEPMSTHRSGGEPHSTGAVV